MKFKSLKIAIRYFRSADRHTFLNIIGLTVGVTLFVLMVMLLDYELSFDSFNSNAKKILQVCEHDLKSGERQAWSAIPLPLTLKSDFPEVKFVAGIWNILTPEAKIKYSDHEFSGFTGASAEPDLFNVFNFRLFLGDIKTVLNDPDKIAISKSAAAKIFGKENPLGKVITSYGFSFTISHVYNDIPDNSTVHFDILFSDKIREKITPDYKVAWWNGGMRTYVILQEGYPLAEFEKHLKEIPSRYYPDFLKGRSTYFTTPFYRSHFNTSLIGQPAVSYAYIILLGCISLIILIIACINYINLTMARAFRMNIDAGIRRISGAGPGHIIAIQVWLSLLNVITAVILALPFSSILMPMFERLSERSLAGQENSLIVWLFALCISLFVGILSGFIPGHLFSKVKPINIIKSRNSFVKINNNIHNGLIIFQFTLTLALIISQLFILRQISFMKNANLGYNNENLLSIQIGGVDLPHNEKYAKAKILKSEIEGKGISAGLTAGSITEDVPGFYFENSFNVTPGDSAEAESVVTATSVDENFTKVFGINMVAGRFFSEDYSTDNNAFIINETAQKRFGWKNIDGKFLKLPFEGEKYQVIGVMKDIHPTTLKEPIPPMIFRFRQHNNFPAFVTFRINPQNEKQVLNLISSEWKSLFPNETFNYIKVRETYFKNYVEEQRLSKIIGIFAVLAVFLSLLGLIGLITFYFERRIKEIAIRKINGATVMDILALLNRDFMGWIFGAFILACPVSAYCMHKWLQTFAYRVGLSWWIFALAGLMILIITLMTVSLQSWRTATRNPVETLRYE